MDLGVNHGSVLGPADRAQVDVKAPAVAVEQVFAVRLLLEVVEVGRGALRLERAHDRAVEPVLLPAAARVDAEVGAEDARPHQVPRPHQLAVPWGVPRRVHPPHGHAARVEHRHVARAVAADGRQHIPLGLRLAMAVDRPGWEVEWEAAHVVSAAATRAAHAQFDRGAGLKAGVGGEVAAAFGTVPDRDGVAVRGADREPDRRAGIAADDVVRAAPVEAGLQPRISGDADGPACRRGGKQRRRDGDHEHGGEPQRGHARASVASATRTAARTRTAAANPRSRWAVQGSNLRPPACKAGSAFAVGCR